ncbi:MAG: hypothetical protein L6R42_006860 [Xanthoria sp. 1 TBL-2021]|nr:MAG: hypothetical protein L6R42_006860 [Xanthoria sp. 1 TBL-2021]
MAPGEIYVPRSLGVFLPRHTPRLIRHLSPRFLSFTLGSIGGRVEHPSARDVCVVEGRGTAADGLGFSITVAAEGAAGAGGFCGEGVGGDGTGAFGAAKSTLVYDD